MAVQIAGRKVEADPNEVFVERADGVYAYPRKIDALETATKINPKEYALVQEGEQATSAMSMRQGFNGFNHLDTIVKVLKSGLVVPRAKRFITQYQKVNEALQGRAVSYNASGELIEGERLKQYAHTLNHDCWAWINDSFAEGRGFLGLDVVTTIGIENGKPAFQREPLEDCLQEDCYAEVESANSQGFLTRRGKIQKYEPGKSVYFWYPRKDFAVRFGALPGDAFFGCDGDPQYSDSRLGVFVCAEGAEKK